MSFVPTAEPALTVSAARATTAPIVCCVNSVRNTYVNAAGDALNVSSFVNPAVRNARTAPTGVFAKTAESATTVLAETATTARTVIFANFALIISASDAARAARNVPSSVPSAARNVRTVPTISSAAIVRCASSAAAGRVTTAKNAACAKCAWILSATTATAVRSVPMSARTAAKNVLIVLNWRCALSAVSALTASGVRETTARNAYCAKTASTRSATAAMGVPTAP